MRSKRDIKMGRLCTPVLGIVGGGVRFRFLNGEAIFEEYMLFWVRLYALVSCLENPTRFQSIMAKIIWAL